MRLVISLALMSLPLVAAANPCEELARAICPAEDQVGKCLYFVNDQMRGPGGEKMSGASRLMGCKLALDDAATLADYKTRMKAKADTRWFTMQVNVEPRKKDGKAWDGFGGAPDIAACFTVDGESIGCRPEGKAGASVTKPKCRDSMSCDFEVQVRDGAMVVAQLIDVDSSENDLIGTCAFTAGSGSAQCDGPVRLTTEGGASAGAGMAARIVGRWEIDVERTMSRNAEFKALAPEQRVAAIEAAVGTLGESFIEFGKDGRLTGKIGEEHKTGRYVVTGMKGKTLTVETTEDGGKVETVEVEVQKSGLVVTEAKGDAVVLRRAP